MTKQNNVPVSPGQAFANIMRNFQDYCECCDLPKGYKCDHCIDASLLRIGVEEGIRLERCRSEKLLQALKWIACEKYSRDFIECHDNDIPIGIILVDRARQALKEYENDKQGGEG